ncbi:pyridine nucleotide-disulphide oxidoreductase family protein [Oceanicola granulosus HTCC2516]|uniref:Pyridine nucleotide-disulphide oxidoreductase family protein n=1 Tax=Oceanicola granulosus (strain ATCC BAA-861 / DSM 15982 / KCTC 12143 / HTCC2516) TaxID=314256 RepID=Q2CAL4_OCEGH|nr:FAD-dependent oxidoreductase [Oceanicola granulosus]EAR49699.1 pyridine nucleotide-disulphide oxidoreductase family protein [Oceanicola granulosus HTCC2516]
MAHFVVIGAGQAGASLVAKLRAEGFEGDVTLIGAEPVPPYQRPPLSKAYLLGEMEESRLYLRPRGWYDAHDVTLRTATRAVGIDPEAKVVTLQGEEPLPYDELALTTGSNPRVLPADIGGDLERVYCMRDLQDADALAPELVAGRRVLVIGGGYIGLEAAAVAARKGLHVTLVEMAPRILQRVAADVTSDFFRALHAGHGVDVREGVGLDRLLGTDAVTGARLTDGTELDVDFVVVGVGIAPASILAESAGIACDNGIRTDEFGRTSAPHVWAAGDCASFPYRGGRIRLESVGNAIDMAETVARNMLGQQVPYDARPWFWSDQYDCKLQIGGLNMGFDNVHVKQGEGGAVSHWYYRGAELIAVDAMNDARNYMIGKKLIEMGKSPPPEVVVDPATDMKALLKA